MRSVRLPLILTCVFWFCGLGCSEKPPAISLHQAIETGNLKAVQQHVAAKSDLNKIDRDGWTPLHLATLKGNLAVVQALTTGGADLNRRANTVKRRWTSRGRKTSPRSCNSSSSRNRKAAADAG
jgi:ankyrin repeat protein